MKRFLASTLAALLIATNAAPALAADATADHPGLIQIDWKAAAGGAEPTATIRLTPTLIRFFASMASEAATEVAELKGVQEIIGQLHEARVLVFEDVSPQGLGPKIDQLKKDGWEEIVRAQDDGDHLEVLILPSGESIVGIATIAIGGDEFAVVNIAGDFDPAELGKHVGSIAKELNSGKIKLKELAERGLGDLLKEIEGK